MTAPRPLILPRRQLLRLAAAATFAATALPLVAVAAARSFYVAPNGNDNHLGTRSSPWRTINRAMQSALRGGDEVVVLPGTYTERVQINRGGNADRSDGYVTLRSATRGGARIRPPSGTYSTILVKADYVVVDGFDVVGGNGHAIDVEDCHHTRVINCRAHDSGGSGISFNRAEFMVVDSNLVYRNAATNTYHCSGISLYQNRNISGDGSRGGFRAIVSRNICWGNFQRWGDNHTDGNGIIIDDFQHTQTTGQPNYTFPTLVENNLCYGNGGKGIQVTWADHVTVRHNTCWRNNLDNNNRGTWRGELNNAQSSNNKWINNIGVADPSVNGSNTAIANNSYGGYVNRNTIWLHNLSFNGRTGQASLSVNTGNAAPRAQEGNLLGVDPRFVRAAMRDADFRLQSASPALGAGTTAHGVPSKDLAGTTRRGAPDLGAYQRSSSQSSPPRTPVAEAPSSPSPSSPPVAEAPSSPPPASPPSTPTLTLRPGLPRQDQLPRQPSLATPLNPDFMGKIGKLF